MGNSCVYKPTLKVNNKEVESKLFNDLLLLTNNRELSKNLWGLASISEFTKNFENLQYDENGELTIESLNSIVNIKDFENNNSFMLEKKKIGAVDDNNNVIKYDDVQSTVDKVIQFNSFKENNNVVGSVTKQGKEYIINVQPKSLSTIEDSQKLVFSNSINNELLNLMRSLGFDVSVVNDLKPDGVFNPLNGESTLDGLKTVIEIAQGKRGEDAFPEEFSHFFIQGLLNNPLVQRSLNSIDSVEAVQQILGSEFDEYNSLYEGDLEQLKKEALGKLLSNHIKNKEQKKTITTDNLISRLWNFIKTKLNRIKESDIQKAINIANNAMLELSNSLSDNNVISLFDKSLIQNTKPLYKINNEIDKLQEINDEALKVAIRKFNILKARTKREKSLDKNLKSLKNLQKLIEEKKYFKSSTTFLKDTISQLKDLQDKINSFKELELDNKTDLEKIRTTSSALREISEFASGYNPIIQKMLRMETLQKEGVVDLSEEDAATISQLSSQVATIINNLNHDYKDLRLRVSLAFYERFYGKERFIEIGKNKGEVRSLEMILTMSEKDINGIDRWITAMSDASDPLLSIIDKVVKVQQGKRDTILQEVLLGMREIHQDLIDSGNNPEFMYERDKKGKVTGRIISNIDFVKFNEARLAFIKELRSKKLSNYQVRIQLEKWDAKNTEEIVIDSNTGKTEFLPKNSIYYIDRLSKLNTAQRKYYDDMMNFKAMLDSYLPNRYTNIFNAVQIRNELVEGVMNNITDPKKATKLMVENLKDKFLERSDDIDYGSAVIEEDQFDEWVITNNVNIATEEDVKKARQDYRKYLTSKQKKIVTDFSGKPIEKLPIYYTQPLEDLDRLSLDFTSSMLAYSTMAINYNEMNKIIDIIELTRDLVYDKKILQQSGDKQLIEILKIGNKLKTEAYKIDGRRSNIGGRLDDYIASNLYGKRKKDHGSFGLFGARVSYSKTGDAIKEYTQQLGLGLNLFSAISNLSVGNAQLLIEGFGKEYYDYKDVAKGIKEYYKLLPEYMGELNSITKKSIFSLLIDKFDSQEEFNKDLSHKNFYKSPMARIFGGANLMFMQQIGEHYLHNVNMLAVLNSTKVLDGKNSEVSIYGMFDKQDVKNSKGKIIGSRLFYKEGTKTKEGDLLFTVKMQEELESLRKLSIKSKATEKRLKELLQIKEFTDDYNIELKLNINKIAQSLNGAYSDIDKGAVQRNVLGRLAMQFRNWMPAHYNRRMASKYYDAQLGQDREGYYRTLGNFTWNLIKDIKNGQFHLATNYANLSAHEKANINRSLTELIMFAVLAGLVSLAGDEKDKKGDFFARMALYQLKRLKLETSASIPIHPNILDNLWTILQSPAPSIKTFDTLSNLLQFWNVFNELESGRYKGWNEYTRDAVKAAPIVNQSIKIYDITEEDYMFTIYN